MVVIELFGSAACAFLYILYGQSLDCIGFYCFGRERLFLIYELAPVTYISIHIYVCTYHTYFFCGDLLNGLS